MSELVQQDLPRAEEELVDLFDCLLKSVRCVGRGGLMSPTPTHELTAQLVGPLCLLLTATALIQLTLQPYDTPPRPPGRTTPRT